MARFSIPVVARLPLYLFDSNVETQRYECIPLEECRHDIVLDTRLPQAKEREKESKARLALLEEQLSVKESALGLMEEDLQKVGIAIYLHCFGDGGIAIRRCIFAVPLVLLPMVD